MKIRNKFFRPLLFSSGAIIASTAMYWGTALAVKREPLSTLSPGDFERLLEIPDSEAVEPSSDIMKSASETYSKLPFDIGERIRFVVTYLGVKAGVAETIVRPPIKWNGTWAHRVSGEVKNAAWFAWMLQLHDSVESVFSNDTEMLPLRFYINQQEPVNFRQSKILQFEATEGVVKQITLRKDRDVKQEKFPLTKDTKDALAALYYFRENFKEGAGKTPIKFPIFTSEKTWTAEAALIRQEKIELSGNEFDTDVYHLKTSFGHLMQQKGDIKIWITRDFRRLPVFIEAQVKFGNIKVALTEWDPGTPDPTKKRVFASIRPR